MIKRIIFDIDGTLITGVDFSSYVANTLKKYGIEDLEKTKQFLLNIKRKSMQIFYFFYVIIENENDFQIEVVI